MLKVVSLAATIIDFIASLITCLVAFCVERGFRPYLVSDQAAAVFIVLLCRWFLLFWVGWLVLSQQSFDALSTPWFVKKVIKHVISDWWRNNWTNIFRCNASLH